MSGALLSPLQVEPANPLEKIQQWQNVLATEANRYKTMAETMSERERPAYLRAQTATERERPAFLRSQTALQGAQVPYYGALTTKTLVDAAMNQMLIQARKDAAGTYAVPGAGGAPAGGGDTSYTPSGVTGRNLLQGGGVTTNAPGAEHPAPTAPQQPNALGTYATTSEAVSPDQVDEGTVATPTMDATIARLRQQQGQPNVLRQATQQPPAAPAEPAPGQPTQLAPQPTQPPVQPQQGAEQPYTYNPDEPYGRTPSPNGVMLPGKVPMPRQTAQAANSALMQGANSLEIDKQIVEQRKAAITQAAAAATDNRTWNMGVNNLYQQGWLSREERDAYLNRFDRQQSVIESNASAETLTGRNTSLTGMGLRPSPTGPMPDRDALRVKPPIQGETTIDVPGPNGTTVQRPVKVMIPAEGWVERGGKLLPRGQQGPEGMVPVQTEMTGNNGQKYPMTMWVPPDMVQQQGAGGGAAGGGAAAPAPGGAPAAGGAPGPQGAAPAGDNGASLTRYKQQTKGFENPTGNPAARNPNSTAMGNSQWLEGTWLDQMQRNFPEIAAGKTREQLLALRANPELDDAALETFTRENAAKLAQQGIPVNGASLHLAHYFGANGMRAIIDGDTNAPVSRFVSPEVLAANKELRNMTVGQLVNREIRKYGTGPVDLSGVQPGGASRALSAAPAPAPSLGPTTPTPQQAGLPPGTMMGQPGFSPDTEVRVAADTKQLDKDSAYVAELQDTQKAGEQAQTQLLNIRKVAEPLDTGKWGDVRADIANMFKTLFPNDDSWANQFLKATTGIDPSKAGAWQELAKQTLTVAGQAESQVAGGRGGFNLVRLYQKSFPGLETQPEALREMVNLFMIGHQYNIDHGKGASEHFNKARDAFTANPATTPYDTMSKFDSKFLDQGGVNAPAVYVAAAAIMNGHPKAEAFAGLTREQQVEAVKIMRRADPNAGYTPKAARK